MKQKITFLGAGSWGTALAQSLADKGFAPVMWDINTQTVAEINASHTNRAYFADLPLAETITATEDLSSAVTGADFVVLAVPSGAIRSVLTDALPYLGKETTIVNVAKGFDPQTHDRMSKTIYAVLTPARKNAVVNLIGPSHAEEVVQRMLTSVCAVSADTDAAARVQTLFSGDYLRLYLTTDEIGAEYGAAMKNVIALAAGMLDGRGYGDNAKAALVTRGLNEMIHYGTAKGGKKDTFFGLTGVGDLIVTCFSPHSRNYQAGKAIGMADGAAAFLSANTKTVEGIAACKVVAEDARQNGVEMPIIEAVYSVLYEGVMPSVAIRTLMERPLKAEHFTVVKH